jgi:uncharacterized protein (DUF1810 family)
MGESHNLQRFIDAQAGVYELAREELRSGQKTGHWMWFVFPQAAGLGSSPTAVKFAIGSADEARAFGAHPLLGPRLIELTAIVLSHADKGAREIFGNIDAMKFRSSMTLFHMVAADNAIFQQAIEQFFQGKPDPNTLEWLSRNQIVCEDDSSA